MECNVYSLYYHILLLEFVTARSKRLHRRGLFNKYADWCHKKVLYLEVTCLGPLQSTLFPNSHTYPNDVSTSWNSPGTLLLWWLRRICLNLRNRLESSSFEGYFKFWEQENVTTSKIGWLVVGWVGKNRDRVFG